jgi:hypothetical protein
MGKPKIRLMIRSGSSPLARTFDLVALFERSSVEVELRRPLLDPAEQQVLDGVEAHRAEAQGVPDGGMEVLEAEGLQKPQHLDILAPPHLQHARLHQAAEAVELLGQMPFRQWRRLVEGVDLLLDQGKTTIMASSFSERTVDLASLGPAGRSLTVSLFLHLAAVF